MKKCNFMTQQSQYGCPRCDTPVLEGQRFCSNCGMAQGEDLNQATEHSSGKHNTTLPVIPPPPPPPNILKQPNRYQASDITYQSPLPDYARAPYPKQRNRLLRKIGVSLLALILIVVALCGTASYFGYRWASTALNKATTIQQTNTTGNRNGEQPTNSHTTGSTPIVTTLNLKSVTYSSVAISILNTQQAYDFPDDQPYNVPGILRITMNEENNSSRSADYFYSESMHVLLPDHSEVAPLKSKDAFGPAEAIKRTTWIDFPVPTNIKPADITLRLGKTTESQIDIPLKSDANLDAYQPHTVTLNTSIHYGNSTWKLIRATQQLSYNATQADAGSVYIVVDLAIDNASQTSFYPFPNDTVRLQSGATKNGPTDTTLPSSLDAGQTNAQGSCAFLMPAGSTNYTFLLLPNTFAGINQSANAQFQIK
jgi:hypothetical protein